MSEMRSSGRTPVYESRQPGRNFTMYASENRAVIYVDGMAGLTGGWSISSLDFFVVTDTQPDSDPALGVREVREIRLRLTMPTAQLIESLLNLVEQLRSNADGLVQANSQGVQAFNRQIERLRALNPDRPNV
jgi:hypothetical protein